MICIVVKNLTKAVIDGEDFPNENYMRPNFSSKSVERGITMGVVLGKKLKIRSEVRELRTMRQRNRRRIERRESMNLVMEWKMYLVILKSANSKKQCCISALMLVQVCLVEVIPTRIASGIVQCLLVLQWQSRKHD